MELDGLTLTANNRWVALTGSDSLTDTRSNGPSKQPINLLIIKRQVRLGSKVPAGGTARETLRYSRLGICFFVHLQRGVWSASAVVQHMRTDIYVCTTIRLESQRYMCSYRQA